MKQGLENAKAFDIEYASDRGLIEKTKLLTDWEMGNLKKLNEEMWDPEAGDFVPTPAKDMFDRVIAGTPVPKIQSE